jgi:hypothetical protein
MSFAAALAAAATLLAAALASGLVRARRRRARVPPGVLDFGPASALAPAGAKHLAIHLRERLPMHLPLPPPGVPSRRLGLLLGLR